MVGAVTVLPLQSVTLPGGTEVDLAFGLGGTAAGAFVSTLLVAPSSSRWRPSTADG